MPVRKYKDVADLEELWHARGPALFAAIRRVWDFAARTTQPRFPHGVYRHRSVEEMNAQDERWAQANFDSFHARRASGAKQSIT